jgi:hypothetical protein
MKLETTNKKKYPCEQCVDGIYMKVEKEWWCDKHLMYACQMKKNRLCEKFERDDAVSRTPTRPAQEALAIERYQDLVDYFDDKDVAKTILGSREEFKKWLERIRWHVRKADELARKVDQKPCEDCVSRQAVLDMASVIETDDFSGNEIMKVVDVDDIKALPSVTPASKPEQSCEDAVSRKEMLDYQEYLHGKMSNEENYKLWEFIKALPSVTSAQKKSERAHWIDNHNGTISCSCCHAWFHKDDRYSYMRYCPNCGAKMEAEKNE